MIFKNALARLGQDFHIHGNPLGLIGNAFIRYPIKNLIGPVCWQQAILLIFALLTADVVNASVEASINRQQVAMGQTLTLRISLPEASTQPNLSPLAQNFDVLGQSTSSQTSMINGKTTSSNQLIVTLMPKKIGRLVIPKIQVGSDYTQPITVTVRQRQATDLGGHKSNLYLVASLGQDSTYVDSPIIYTLKLYDAAGLQSGSFEPPAMKGFTLQTLGKPVRYSDEQQGKVYQVNEQRFLLTPKRSGKLTIPPMAFRGRVASGSSQGFGGFLGFSSGKPVVFTSNALTLKVKAIPPGLTSDQWLPADQVTLTQRFSPEAQHYQVGVPLTRTITVTAVGALKGQLPDLHLTAPANANAYPDQPILSERYTTQYPVATRVLKIAYIPTQQGKLTFPGVSVAWWNIKTNRAQTAMLPAISFTIKPGKTIAQSKAVAVPQAQPVPSAQPVTPATHIMAQHPVDKTWRYVSIVLLILWLLTLVIWLYSARRRARYGVVSSESVPSVKQAIAAIKSACDQADIKVLQQAVLIWAKAQWPGRRLLVLGDIAYCDGVSPELLKLLEELDQAIYQAGHFDHYEQLFALIRRQRSPRDHSRQVLSDLYS